MAINGDKAATGTPGSYVTLRQGWRDGGVITLELPVTLKVTEYAGTEQVSGNKRFALEYGPVLKAFRGPFNFGGRFTKLDHGSCDIATWLESEGQDTLHFAIQGYPEHDVLPY